ncbi:MAG: hypothetical protein ACQEWV_00765 [Bacillota bacterium]
MFENEYTLKKLFEVINDELEKKAFENMVRKEKRELFGMNQRIRVEKKNN